MSKVISEYFTAIPQMCGNWRLNKSVDFRYGMLRVLIFNVRVLAVR